MARLMKRKIVHTVSGGPASRSSVYRKGLVYPDEYAQELTPLDVIKQDTDILSDDNQPVFELPPSPMEVVDYFGHYFLPVEKAA
jgi:hypothetical protein